MRCFYVRVHGTLDWHDDHAADEEMFTPAGFYCHRYVLAAGYEDAAAKALRLVRRSLERQTGWLRKGLTSLSLQAEELTPAPMHKLLRRGNRGQEFYDASRSVPANERKLIPG